MKRLRCASAWLILVVPWLGVARSSPPAPRSGLTIEKFWAIEPGCEGIEVYWTLGEPATKTWTPAGITWHYVIGDRRVYVHFEQDGIFGRWRVVSTGPDWAIPPWELERRMVPMTEEKLREEIPIPATLFPLVGDEQRPGTPSLPWGLTERSR